MSSSMSADLSEPLTPGELSPCIVRSRMFNNATSAGRVGLENLGNTCFMNAGLQCLSHLEPLAAYFLSETYERDLNTTSRLGCKGEFAKVFAELQQVVWQTDQPVYKPNALRAKLAGFAPHLFDEGQQDAQEFLAFCLDALHEDLNRVIQQPPPLTEEELKRDASICEQRGEDAAGALAWLRHLERNKSFLVDLMQGQLQSSLKCSCCGHKSRQFDPFLYLSLPVDWDMFQLTDALDKYLDEERLVGDEQWYCEKCRKKVDAMKKIDLWMLPPVLILHLKRISFNARTGKMSKIGRLLSSPSSLDLSRYCSSPQKQGAKYDVVCVVNHNGRASDGHYSALCLVGEQWFRFDDDSVRAFHAREVVTAESYMIFLVKQSTGGVHGQGHQTPWLRQQSVSQPENWPHPLQVVQENSFIQAKHLERAMAATGSLRRSLSPRVAEEGYVMALPDVITADADATGPTEAEEGEVAENASPTNPHDGSCLKVILRLLCGA